MILALLSLAFAEPDPPATELPSAAQGPSARALEMLDGGKGLTARRLAELALLANPDDFVAHYVIGRVWVDEEGNLPRGLHHLRRADTLFVRDRARYPEDAWKTHWHVLRHLAWVAQSMEDRELFFDTVDRYNELYSPVWAAERAWVLMSDGQLDEARQVALAGVASTDDWQQTLGLNVLCALEAKQGDRPAALRACLAALEKTRATGGDRAVDAYNAFTAALGTLDFVQAEALLTEACTGASGGSTNPWRAVADFELARGRGEAAVSAVQRMQAWRHAEPPPERAQSRAGSEAVVASVLLVVGAPDKGMELIDRALAQPDRRAHTTASASGTLAGHTLLRLAMRRLTRERDAELHATAGLLRRAVFRVRSWMPEPADWQDTTAVVGALTDAELLSHTFAVYEDGGIIAPRWLIGDLIPVLGAGVAQAAVDRARARDVLPGLGAYHDAMEAEIAWWRGQSRTSELVDGALAGLPEAEVLVRARVAAIGADHAWRDGDRSRAWALYERALQLDPSVLRRLGLALPATVGSSGGEVEDAAAAMFERSPRFVHDPSGFRLDVRNGEACLSSPSGSRLGCHRARGAAVPEADAAARALVLAFHDAAFSLPLGASRLDMRSLDGTTRLDEDARRRAIDGVVRGL